MVDGQGRHLWLLVSRREPGGDGQAPTSEPSRHDPPGKRRGGALFRGHHGRRGGAGVRAQTGSRANGAKIRPRPRTRRGSARGWRGQRASSSSRRQLPPTDWSRLWRTLPLMRRGQEGGGPAFGLGRIRLPRAGRSLVGPVWLRGREVIASTLRRSFWTPGTTTAPRTPSPWPNFWRKNGTECARRATMSFVMVAPDHALHLRSRPRADGRGSARHGRRALGLLRALRALVRLLAQGSRQRRHAHAQGPDLRDGQEPVARRAGVAACGARSSHASI